MVFDTVSQHNKVWGTNYGDRKDIISLLVFYNIKTLIKWWTLSIIIKMFNKGNKINYFISSTKKPPSPPLRQLTAK